MWMKLETAVRRVVREARGGRRGREERGGREGGREGEGEQVKRG
jgi:hypothetical protein